MSDILQRLRALNEKLEAKLNAKKNKKSEQTSSSKEGAQELAQIAKEPATPPKSEIKAKAQEDHEDTLFEDSELLGNEIFEWTQKLFHHLEIDTSAEPIRAQNLERLVQLFSELDIKKKVERIEDLFIYKAMNISGIGLKEEDFAQIREGKYVQVIAITYEPDKNGKKKAKNISLGYFGKAEALDSIRKNRIIEFVLRWRYEKAFQNLEHYRTLLTRIELR